MLMRTYEHNCRTTFVNGINPFLAATERPKLDETPEEAPQSEAHLGRPPSTSVDILALLSDGIPRTADDIAIEIYGNPKSIATLLLKLTSSGKLSRTFQRRVGVRPKPLYQLWSE